MYLAAPFFLLWSWQFAPQKTKTRSHSELNEFILMTFILPWNLYRYIRGDDTVSSFRSHETNQLHSQHIWNVTFGVKGQDCTCFISIPLRRSWREWRTDWATKRVETHFHSVWNNSSVKATISQLKVRHEKLAAHFASCLSLSFYFKYPFCK